MAIDFDSRNDALCNDFTVQYGAILLLQCLGAFLLVLKSLGFAGVSDEARREVTGDSL